MACQGKIQSSISRCSRRTIDRAEPVFIEPGDVTEVGIEGLGELRSTAAASESREYLFPIHQKAGFAL